MIHCLPTYLTATLLTASGDRSLIFISLGAIGFIPILHAHLSPNLTLPPDYPFANFAGGAALYVLGAAFYVNRVPEKYWPNVFDIWVGTLFHYTLSNALSISMRTKSYKLTIEGVVCVGCKPSDLPRRSEYRSTVALVGFEKGAGASLF